MKRRTLCQHRVLPDGTQHPGCGAQIVLVLCVPEVPTSGRPRKFVPLNPTYDPACGIRPSHAVSTGWTTCRPLPEGEDPGPTESPALIHFATCPHRRKPTP